MPETAPGAFETDEKPMKQTAAQRFAASVAGEGQSAAAAKRFVASVAEAAEEGQAKPSSTSFAAPGADPDRAKRAPGKTLSNQTWSKYTVADLVRIRDEITLALPALSLEKLNLEEEVLLQFHVMRSMQADVLEADDVPANQRAQVANAVGAILKTLADRQIQLYSSERFKDIENLLIRTLDKLPENAAVEFMGMYTKILTKSSN